MLPSGKPVAAEADLGVASADGSFTPTGKAPTAVLPTLAGPFVEQEEEGTPIPIEAFRSLPPHVQSQLLMLSGGTRVLTQSQVVALMAQISAPQSIGIPISSFPPKMQSQLAELDDSGDGIIGTPFPPPAPSFSFARHSFRQRARCRSCWIPNSEWKPDAFPPF